MRPFSTRLVSISIFFLSLAQLSFAVKPQSPLKLTFKPDGSNNLDGTREYLIPLDTLVDLDYRERYYFHRAYGGIIRFDDPQNFWNAAITGWPSTVFKTICYLSYDSNGNYLTYSDEELLGDHRLLKAFTDRPQTRSSRFSEGATDKLDGDGNEGVSAVFCAAYHIRLNRFFEVYWSRFMGNDYIMAFEQKLYTDLVIKCSTETFNVHRSIVAPQSGFLQKCLSTEFIESNSQEIYFRDDEPIMVVAMLHHLYGLDYEKLYRPTSLATKPLQKPMFFFGTNATPPTAQEEDPSEELEPDAIATLHAKMYIMGDKYDIPTLRVTAKQNFEELSDRHAHQLALIPLIQLVYEGTSAGDSGLRTTIINLILRFRRLDDLKEIPLFDNIMQNQPEFTYDLSRAMMQKFRIKNSRATNASSEDDTKSTESSSVTSNYGSTSSSNRTKHRNGMKLRCEECRRSFSSRQSLVQHDADFHQYCTDCRLNLQSQDEARAHRMNVHGGF